MARLVPAIVVPHLIRNLVGIPLIMQLVYDTTLSDIAEAHTRFAVRSRTFKQSRLYYSLGIALGPPLFLLLFSRDTNTTAEWAGAVVVSCLLAILFFVSRKTLISRRLHKYCKQEVGDVLPYTTHYSVDDRALSCTGRDVDITFTLETLEDIADDGRYLEISFGTRGLCAIPLRAFESDTHKEEFVSAIRRTDTLHLGTAPSSDSAI